MNPTFFDVNQRFVCEHKHLLTHQKGLLTQKRNAYDEENLMMLLYNEMWNHCILKSYPTTYINKNMTL